MAPTDPKRKGPPGPFGGAPFGRDPFGTPEDFRRFFDEFERQFAREFEQMQRLMGQVFQDAMGAAERTKPGEPFVYGFKLRVGPDGRPQFESFGNTHPTVDTTEGGAAVQVGAREPMTDLIESDHEIAVTVELPGVAKEDINLHVAADAVTIKVPAGERHPAYHKAIRLPAPVKADSAEATYKNGILDITLQRVRPGPGGTRVPIK